MKKYTVFLCALILLAPLTANAVPMTFDFSGTVNYSGGIWGGVSIVAGSYTYDTALVDLAPSSGSNDRFFASTGANQAFSWDLTVTAGGVTRSTSNNQNSPGTNHHYLDLINSSVDRYAFYANRYGSTDDFGRILLQHTTGAAFGPLPNTAPTTAPNLTDFNFQSNFYYAYDNSGALEGYINFNLTSVTSAIAPVPEPATMLLLGSGLIGMAAVGRRKFFKK
jgi:hypothetical protein